MKEFFFLLFIIIRNLFVAFPILYSVYCVLLSVFMIILFSGKCKIDTREWSPSFHLSLPSPYNPWLLFAWNITTESVDNFWSQRCPLWETLEGPLIETDKRNCMKWTCLCNILNLYADLLEIGFVSCEKYYMK